MSNAEAAGSRGTVTKSLYDATLTDAISCLRLLGEDEYEIAITELKCLIGNGPVVWSWDGASTSLDPYGYLADYTQEALQNEATRRGRTMPELIRGAVGEWLEGLGYTYEAWRDIVEECGYSVPPTYWAWLEEQEQQRASGVGEEGQAGLIEEPRSAWWRAPERQESAF